MRKRLSRKNGVFVRFLNKSWLIKTYKEVKPWT